MASVKPLDGGKHAGRSNRDLTPFQWHAAMIINNSTKPALGLEGDSLIDLANNSQDFEGVIDYPGNLAGRHTTITTAGRSKIKGQGVGNAGDSIKVVEGGKAAKANADEQAIGNALSDWVDGEVFPFTIDKHVAKADAAPVPTGTPIANNSTITDFGAVLTLTPPASSSEPRRVGFAGVKDQVYRLTYIYSQADTVSFRVTDFNAFQITSQPLQKGQSWGFTLGDNEGGNLLFIENPSSDTGPITFKLELVS